LGELSTDETEIVKEIVRLEKDNIEASRAIRKVDRPSDYEQKLEVISKKLESR
jgi:hypothetical protein